MFDLSLHSPFRLLRHQLRHGRILPNATLGRPWSRPDMYKLKPLDLKVSESMQHAWQSRRNLARSKVWDAGHGVPLTSMSIILEPILIAYMYVNEEYGKYVNSFLPDHSTQLCWKAGHLSVCHSHFAGWISAALSRQITDEAMKLSHYSGLSSVSMNLHRSNAVSCGNCNVPDIINIDVYIYTLLLYIYIIIIIYILYKYYIYILYKYYIYILINSD